MSRKIIIMVYLFYNYCGKGIQDYHHTHNTPKLEIKVIALFIIIIAH